MIDKTKLSTAEQQQQSPQRQSNDQTKNGRGSLGDGRLHIAIDLTGDKQASLNIGGLDRMRGDNARMSFVERDEVSLSHADAAQGNIDLPSGRLSDAALLYLNMLGVDGLYAALTDRDSVRLDSSDATVFDMNDICTDQLLAGVQVSGKRYLMRCRLIFVGC